VAQVEMERGGVFGGFGGFGFVVIEAATTALEVSGPQMHAGIHLSHFAHFSIKIIITPTQLQYQYEGTSQYRRRKGLSRLGFGPCWDLLFTDRLLRLRNMKEERTLSRNYSFWLLINCSTSLLLESCICTPRS
jgi:hypothetical protein